jgi:hypothetical protein
MPVNENGSVVEVICNGVEKIIEIEKAFPPIQSGGNDRYERVFGSSELDVNNDLVVTHNFTERPTSVRVLDQNREKIYPDNERDIDTGLVKGLVLNFQTYTPFSNFIVILEV